MIKFTVITLFPNIIEEYINSSIIQKAIKNNLVQIDVVNLRKFGKGSRRNTDDTVYGGGSGMIITVPVLDEAIDSIVTTKLNNKFNTTKIIYLSPKGKTLNQQISKELSKQECTHYILICGHYEGIDDRIFNLYNIEEISIGEYILTGGELAALVLLDSITRLIPKVLPDNATIDESMENNLLEHKQYTKPESYKGLNVPAVLLSGNHKEIDKFRQKSKIEETKNKRPDLLKEQVN